MFGRVYQNLQAWCTDSRHREGHVGTELKSMRTFEANAVICSEPIARSNGCSSVRTYTGHGINNLFHTAPNVPHYAKNKAVGTMKPGMVRVQLLQRNVGNKSTLHTVLHNRARKKRRYCRQERMYTDVPAVDDQSWRQLGRSSLAG